MSSRTARICASAHQWVRISGEVPDNMVSITANTPNGTETLYLAQLVEFASVDDDGLGKIHDAKFVPILYDEIPLVDFQL